MHLTYEAYPLPYSWLNKNSSVAKYRPQNNFLPDQILIALEGIVPTARAYLALPKGKLPQAQNSKKIFSREQSLSITQNCVSSIHPAFGKEFARAVKRGWIEFTHRSPGQPKDGACYHRDVLPRTDPCPAFIEITGDGSSDDAACIIHEFGHYIAYQRQGWRRGLRTVTVRTVYETQARLFEHALHHRFSANDVKETDFAQALIYDRSTSQRLLAHDTVVGFSNLQNIMTRGEFIISNPKSKIVDYDNYLYRSGGIHEQHDPGYLLGLLAFGALNATGSARERSRFLNALYPEKDGYHATCGAPTLVQVLDILGITSQSQLNMAFRDLAKEMFAPEMPKKRLKQSLTLPAQNAQNHLHI